MRLQVALVLCAALALTVGFATATGSAHAAAHPPAYVVITDDDFDAVAALVYLGEAARSGRIDLRAVSVEIDGFAPPGPACRTPAVSSQSSASQTFRRRTAT